MFVVHLANMKYKYNQYLAGNLRYKISQIGDVPFHCNFIGSVSISISTKNIRLCIYSVNFIELSGKYIYTTCFNTQPLYITSLFIH